MKTAVSTREYFKRTLVRSILRGELQLHELPGDLSPDDAAEVRRRAMEEMADVSMRHVGTYSLDSLRASRRHCENFIGVAQIPMGIVGPLLLRGEHVQQEEVWVPLATTEGALVASTNRGCTALRAAGGAVVHVEDVGMTRAPVFRTEGIQHTQQFLAWVRSHEDEMRELAESTSSHLRLVDIRPTYYGTTVFLRFRFESGDAMGMNMATIACDHVVRRLIEPATNVPCIAISGNYCVDKKPAAINFQEGRGKRIHAEITLDARILRDILKTTAEELVEVQYRKNLLGSIAGGALGFNAHYANVLAAFFIATGQDLAHVVGGSMGITCIEPRGEDGVIVSVFLPDVPLGAIGGGTALDTQREALDLLNVRADPQHPGKATLRLAEILGGTVLAGELSLMAAFTSGDLTTAHEKLARGKLPQGDRG